MGRIFQHYLTGNCVYQCTNCKTHLAQHEGIVSKQFQGRHGRAYLFQQAVNVKLGPREERVLITGLHTVCDIFCSVCQTVLGWKYEEAYEENQKYKVGKFIIEKSRMEKEYTVEASS